MIWVLVSEGQGSYETEKMIVYIRGRREAGLGRLVVLKSDSTIPWIGWLE